MLPELPRDIQRTIMHIRRSEDAACTIQRYWRGMRWRQWLRSESMPLVSSWHPHAKFLDAERFDSIFYDIDEVGDETEHAQALRTELHENVHTYRALTEMAAAHYGQERIDSRALMERAFDREHDYESIVEAGALLADAIDVFHGVPTTAVQHGNEPFIRAIATLVAPVGKRRRLA